MERDTPFETPWASNQLPNPRICPPWWLGRHTTKSPRHSARYSPDARYGEFARCTVRRETRTTHRPTSHGPLPLRLSQIVGGHTDDDIRHCGGPIGSKLRQKRRSHVFFHGFWPFLGEKGFVCCRVFGIASPGCPRPRRRLSVLHEDARALTYTRITNCSSSADYL